MSWKLALAVLVLAAVAVVAALRLSAGGGAKESAASKRHEMRVDTSGPRPARHRTEPHPTPPRKEPAPSTAPNALAPATSSADQPLSRVAIAVDPGHNGGNASHPEEIARLVPAGVNGTTKPCNTTGTETNDGVLTEAQFNWDVAADLVPRLESLGAEVVLTRHSNAGVGPCVNERAAIANRAHAAVDVAIHADGNETEGAHGFDVIHPTTAEMVAPAMAAPSLKLAVDIRDALVQSGIPPANYVGRNGLDARSDLAGLNLARVPAVLVELGNMRSAAEAAQLEDPAYRQRLAGALAAGIAAFLRP